MWRHKDCGGEVISELWASDSEQDYYLPMCLKCGKGLERDDMYHEDCPITPIAIDNPSVAG
jgi:hypothetical protein